MIRSLIERLSKHRGIAGIGALAIVLAGIIASRSIGADKSPSMVFAADPVKVTTPLDDTGVQRWEIDAPAPLPEPDPKPVPRVPAVQPKPNVNWNALAVGVSDVRISDDVSLARHADVNSALSSSQRKALISEADVEAAGAGSGRLPAFVGAVVARGTPGGGGCK